MRAKITGMVCGAAVIISLTGCGGRTNTGPDEFSVLPGKSLQSPDDLTNLPTPTPGGSNLTDPTPIGDAVTALGGRSSAVNRHGISALDGALLSHTSRYGVTPGLSSQASGQTTNSGARRGLFGRLLSGFGGQALNPFRELERLRAAGIRTPSAPPAP